MRKIGLDVGSRRTGVALSDALCVTAQPFTTIYRSNFDDEVKTLRKLIEDHNVNEVIVGIPYSLNGTVGPQAQLVIDYIAKLRDNLNIPVLEWDERLTTVLAERSLASANLSHNKKKKLVDKVAAALILQSYLDSVQKKGR
ncbi:MAG TPA: Holliday junction resolvase RuvX [Actinobacteria bacterium]|nr:Holliday junction resolvase RuvX [Actinomycetota bacterium]